MQVCAEPAEREGWRRTVDVGGGGVRNAAGRGLHDVVHVHPLPRPQHGVRKPRAVVPRLRFGRGQTCVHDCPWAPRKGVATISATVVRLTGQDIVIDFYPQSRLVTPDNTAPSHDMPAAHVTSVAGLAKAELTRARIRRGGPDSCRA